MADQDPDGGDRCDTDNTKPEKLFTLKKWNAVAMWSWDVECDTCAICRVQVMGKSMITFNFDFLFSVDNLIFGPLFCHVHKHTIAVWLENRVMRMTSRFIIK